MCTRSRIWYRRISKSNWRSITRVLEEEMGVTRVKKPDPHRSSSPCSSRGWENRDLNGADTFECSRCGLRFDSQLNAAINLHMRLRFRYTVGWVRKRKRVEPGVEGSSRVA